MTQETHEDLPYDNEFIEELIQLDETHNLDFIESDKSKKIAPKLIAMANQQGGDVYIGITDKKPRKIKNANFVNVENVVSQSLNNSNPRPSIEYKEYKYLKPSNNENEEPEICNIVRIRVNKSKRLVEHNGEFPFIDIGSSHKRTLKYDEIIAYDRKFQEYR